MSLKVRVLTVFSAPPQFDAADRRHRGDGRAPTWAEWKPSVGCAADRRSHFVFPSFNFKASMADLLCRSCSQFAVGESHVQTFHFTSVSDQFLWTQGFKFFPKLKKNSAVRPKLFVEKKVVQKPSNFSSETFFSSSTVAFFSSNRFTSAEVGFED